MSAREWEGLREAARVSAAWPFEEARKVVKRLEDDQKAGRPSPSPRAPVRFETGYGPSGVPHIGTFAEVARTSMVRLAFQTLMPDVPNELVCFSDDTDGLRKVPTNVPQQDMLARSLGLPLTRVPDPFGCHASFGEHNNSNLRDFLDRYGFTYTFMSAQELYERGDFDGILAKLLASYQDILDVMLPSLREERQATYSPILPISPHSGRVLLVPLTRWDVQQGLVFYRDPETQEEECVSVFGGHCKLQWKAAWAARWVVLNIDYEMEGKDLIDSFALSSRIAQILEGRAPVGYVYEHFLDKEGKRISKSKGNGLSVEEWLKYASSESLQCFMYRAPRQAKRLYFDVIPRTVDHYLEAVTSFPQQSAQERLENPAWYIHTGSPPHFAVSVSFTLLLNLVVASHATNEEVLWGFVMRYVGTITPAEEPELRRLVRYAIQYFHDFIAPTLNYRAPQEHEITALKDLMGRLRSLCAPAQNGKESGECFLQQEDPDASKVTADLLQSIVYDVGKTHAFPSLKAWFSCLYEVLLGQSSGPRFGSFIALYGIQETITLIENFLTYCMHTSQ